MPVPVISKITSVNSLQRGQSGGFLPAITDDSPAASSWEAAFLPPGLAIDPATGLIQGRPTLAGAYNVRIYAINSEKTFTASGSTLTSSAHAMPVGTMVKLTTTNTLPAGLSVGTVYYIVTSATNTFALSATLGGSAITTTSGGTGTHTVNAYSAPLTFPIGVKAATFDEGNMPRLDFSLDTGFVTSPAGLATPLILKPGDTYLLSLGFLSGGNAQELLGLTDIGLTVRTAEFDASAAFDLLPEVLPDTVGTYGSFRYLVRVQTPGDEWDQLLAENILKPKEANYLDLYAELTLKWLEIDPGDTEPSEHQRTSQTFIIRAQPRLHSTAA